MRTIIEMVAATRLDCVLGSTALMRRALNEASWHVAHRSAFGSPARRQAADAERDRRPGRRVRGRDRARDAAGRGGRPPPTTRTRRRCAGSRCRWRSSGSASAPRHGRRGAGVPRRQRLRRGVRAAAALPRGAAELGLGGLGQRQRPRRAARARPRARGAEAWITEVGLARGGDARLDRADRRHARAARRRRRRSRSAARRLAGRMAACLQGSLLVRFAPPRWPTPSAPPAWARRTTGPSARSPGATSGRSWSGPRRRSEPQLEGHLLFTWTARLARREPGRPAGPALVAGIRPGAGPAHARRHLRRDGGGAPRRARRRQRRRGAHLRRARTRRPGASPSGWPRAGRRPRATGSGCGSSPAPPTSTSRSSASCSPAPPTCPVDADDPDERARLVFDEAAAAAVIGNDLVIAPHGGPVGRTPASPADPPTPDDDAWVIFTSGSTGTPKGVAVTHRNAAAFVDAESRMFLQDAPIGPGDRVMAGLSRRLRRQLRGDVAGLGVRRLPGPRAPVAGPQRRRRRAVAGGQRHHRRLHGADPGRAVAAESLDAGPAADHGRRGVPARDRRPAAARRGARSGTPTAPPRRRSSPAAPGSTARTRCASGCPSTAGTSPSSTPEGRPVAEGEIGRADHRRRRAGPLPRPGQGRREVRPDADPRLGARLPQRRPGPQRRRRAGLRRPGRRPGQARRPAHRARRDRQRCSAARRRRAAAAAVRSTSPATSCWSATSPSTSGSTPSPALELLRHRLPAALVPRLAVVDTLPTRTSGKVDRDALPWPLPGRAGDADAGRARRHRGLDRRALARRARRRRHVARATTSSTSAAAASPRPRSVCRLRERFPEVTVADLYENPTVAALAACPGRAGGTRRPHQTARSGPTPLEDPGRPARVTLVPLRTLAGLRWLTWLAARHNARRRLAGRGLPADVPVVGAGPDRAGSSSSRPAGWPSPRCWRALLLRAGRRPATTRAAAGCTCGSGSPSGSGRAGGRRAGRGAVVPARTPGCSAPRSATDVDLHSVPPVTGLLTLGDGCSVEPEVDLTGHWLDGDVLHVGAIRVGARRPGRRPQHARPGRRRRARTPRSRPGSAVVGEVPTGEFWSGSPAERLAADGPRPVAERRRPAEPRLAGRRTPRWRVVIAALPGARGRWRRRWSCWPAGPGRRLLGDARAARRCRGCRSRPSSAYAVLALLVLAARAAARRSGSSAGAPPGAQPAGRWQAWATLRVLDEARTWLFPLYASTLTPVVAAAARRPDRRGRRGLDGAADPAADHGQRPGLPRRRHPDRQLRARRRLAARRARQDRQARLRRQLRDGRPRPQGAQGSRWSRCSPPPRAASKAKAGSSWLGSPPTPAAPRSGDDATTAAPTTRRAGCGVARGLSSCAGSSRCWLARRCSASCWSARCAAAGSTGPGSLVAALLSRAGADGRRRWSPPPSPSPPSGCWSAGMRAVRPPAVELVRLAQRAGRHLRRGASPRRGSPAPRPGTAAAQPLAALARRHGSAAACGARPTGCPRPTWSSCATAPPSTGAAWCRPTCSTTGC